AGRGTPARRRAGTRLARRRGTRRPPLRPADLRPVRGGGDDARVAVPLQHDERGGRAGVRAGAGTEGVRLMQLDQLYQAIILDHYRPRRGRGLREPYQAEAHHVNPTCGDEVTIRVRLADGRVEDVSYDGMGCSISQAAASVLYDL